MKRLLVLFIAILSSCASLKPDVDASTAPRKERCAQGEWVIRGGDWTCIRVVHTVPVHGYVQYGYGGFVPTRPLLNNAPPRLPYVNGGSIPPPAIQEQMMCPSGTRALWTGGDGQVFCGR